nr:autophagy-related protein 16-2 isoform X4 [Microcebus murinus]
MAGPGTPAARWKRHIVRQLRQRDRTQKALFLELVPAYNCLLEKAELLDKFSERLQPEPNDVTPATHQGPWDKDSGPGSDQAPSLATLRVKWQEKEEGLRLECGEMAYQVVEKSAALGALELKLQERQSRLAELEARVAQLREARAQQAGQVAELQARNAERRAAYEALRANTGLQEETLRGLQEQARDLLERLVQRKARAAAERNLRNERRERAKQAQVSQELKKAARRTVSISESQNTLGSGIKEGAEASALAPAPEPESLEREACEKWKRPFRSASATSLTLSRCVDVVKGLLDFKKRRGHSIGGASEQRYQSIPVCMVARLPTRAQDVLDAHLSEVSAVCFGPSSSLLATGGADHLIHLWNVVGGRLEANQTLEGAGGSITSVEFDPSGSQVLAATYNRAAQLWKVGEAQSKETLSGHKDKVTAAKFKLTKHQAVTGSRDRTVKEWDLGRAYCEAQPPPPLPTCWGTRDLALLLGAPGPSMSFPTATMWCVGTISSLVATMTRRSGSGTAGDRHLLWVGWWKPGAGLWSSHSFLWPRQQELWWHLGEVRLWGWHHQLMASMLGMAPEGPAPQETILVAISLVLDSPISYHCLIKGKKFL